MRKRNVGVLAALVLGVILLCASFAFPESAYWTGPTTYTDGSALTAAEKATLTYYIRIDKSNPRDTTGVGGWYYLGETRNGVLSFPADNSLGSLMRSYGFGGTAVNFTVSAAFKDTDGIERDSVPSAPYAWTVPLEVVASLTFNPASGNYTTAQSVTLSTATTGASIRYTTDGSTPSSTIGTLYAGPIAVSATTTIKAIAYKNGMADSMLANATYTFPFRPRTPAAPGSPVVR